MLEADVRERLRRSAEAISSSLSDNEKDTVSEGAYKLIDALRKFGTNDETCVRVALLVAGTMAMLESVPTRHLNDALGDTISAYTFAAGSLAGVYTLPERKVHEHTEECESGPVEPAPEPAPARSPSAMDSGYL